MQRSFSEMKACIVSVDFSENSPKLSLLQEISKSPNTAEIALLASFETSLVVGLTVGHMIACCVDFRTMSLTLRYRSIQNIHGRLSTEMFVFVTFVVLFRVSPF